MRTWPALLALHGLVFLPGAVSRAGADGASPTLSLARELAGEGQHMASALEYRRAAGETGAPDEQAGYLWAAAWQYRCAGESGLSDALLNRAETLDPSPTVPCRLLRAENARADGRPAEAEFHFEQLASAPDTSVARFARRRLAMLSVMAGDPGGARQFLQPASEHVDALEALAECETVRRRSPALGGVLGLVPGLGYAYSAEYGAAVRALLINGLFIYGMVETAHEDLWGPFAVIGFFELTWYSGSIYGGIGAAHRFNDRTRDACTGRMESGLHFEPDLQRLPVVTLRFQF